jgi:hypothetical protein
MTSGDAAGRLVGAMSDYETQRQLHQAFAMALAPRLVERLSWPADRLAAHRVGRLREVVRDAVDRSPWHRERLADVDPPGSTRPACATSRP